MAFKEYRTPSKSSGAHKFDIERFAYDIFAYMLPICGFPEEKIPTTSREENIYIEKDFVLNVGLSILPIALYKRDDWKSLFEIYYKQNLFCTILDIQFFLESVLLHYSEIEEEDTRGKVQFSIALYNEFILFCKYKDNEDYFDILPKSWSRLCEQLIKESEDFDQTFESSFTLRPDVSEAWITNFIRRFAIPYGSTTNVSDNFSLYAFECHPETNNSSEVMSTEGITEVLQDVIAQASNISDINLEPPLTEDSKSGLSTLPGKGQSLVSSEQLQEKGGENVIVETKAHGKNTNGLAYVLQHYLKKRKRTRSPKLEIEDSFKGISLEKENVSPENRDTKRRRKSSGKDKLE